MKKILLALILFSLLYFSSILEKEGSERSSWFLFSSPAFAQSPPPQETIEGKVITIESKNQGQQEIQIEVTKGSNKGKTITVDYSNIESSRQESYKKGDMLLVIKTTDASGKDLYYIADKVRRTALYILFAIFVILALLMGRKQGALSLLGMGVSFLVIFTYILPQIIAGQNPVLTAIIGSTIIIPITFVLSHGMNAKTVMSIVATIAALIITGILSYVFVAFSSLTGLAAEEATFLQAEIGEGINMQGILLAGIIIASLGVLDDITIAQASLVQELKRANEKLMFLELFKRGMNVGRDHIASVINTLVLVYTGASLPLLLLFSFSGKSFSEVVNYEIIAVEIVKMLVGSIGLILAVPITTLIAAYYFQETKNKSK